MASDEDGSSPLDSSGLGGLQGTCTAAVFKAKFYGHQNADILSEIVQCFLKLASLCPVSGGSGSVK